MTKELLQTVKCGNCMSHEKQTRGDVKLDWCKLHEFPIDAKYSCGKFEAKPEKIKNEIITKTLKIPFTNVPDMIEKYFLSIDGIFNESREDEMAFIITKNRQHLVAKQQQQKMYVIPAPSSLVEIIYFLRLCKVNFKLNEEFIAAYDIPDEKPTWTDDEIREALEDIDNTPVTNAGEIRIAHSDDITDEIADKLLGNNFETVIVDEFANMTMVNSKDEIDDFFASLKNTPTVGEGEVVLQPTPEVGLLPDLPALLVEEQELPKLLTVDELVKLSVIENQG